MICVFLLFILGLTPISLALNDYNESLYIKPLPRSKALASFSFDIRSLPDAPTFYDSAVSDVEFSQAHNYKYFPRNLAMIIEKSNTRSLRLRFSQGWWDSEEWGRLPLDGRYCGGTGVEMWAVIEAPNKDAAMKSWFKLGSSLSGFFCASLNFIDSSITSFPDKGVIGMKEGVLVNEDNNLFILRAALPREPICTENLTPFLKLLPSRGKSGVSSLLDGHKVYDSLWHNMAIDVDTVCSSEDHTCVYEMSQHVDFVIDINRSLRHLSETIPRPTPGESLRCDKSKPHDVWQCFPLGDPIDLNWSLEEIFEKNINAPIFESDEFSSTLIIEEFQNYSHSLTSSNEQVIRSSRNGSQTKYLIGKANDLNLSFSAEDYRSVNASASPPIYVSRSLTGYSLDNGGLRVAFHNPSATEKVRFNYFETLPWYMRLYLNTLKVQKKIDGGKFENLKDPDVYIKRRHYVPAIDRKRPSQVQFELEIEPLGSISLTYDFDKSLLLYAEYPPDANHGYEIESAVVSVFDESNQIIYELRTPSLLLSLPTPDFSMPYNVIILTCTIMSIVFGSIFNILTKKVITEGEFENISTDGKLTNFIKKIKNIFMKLKSNS